MIIYFADRKFNITGQASTNLPGGLRISEDTLTEDIESGVNSLNIKVIHDDGSRQDLESAVAVGNFILKSEGRGESDTGYNALFQIIETEYDVSNMEMTIYAEDAGLDLLNRVSGAVSYSNLTLENMMKKFIPAGWTLRILGTAPSTTKSNEWDGESTLTERLLSVANLWGYEIYYTFEVERMQITTRYINVVAKRGNQDAVEQLRLNKDINDIVTKASISELATAFTVTGGTPDGKDDAINLKGYSYSYTDPDTGDVYKVDSSTGQMRNTTAMTRWASVLDTDGLILKSFEYDTTSKATLAGQARAQLQTDSTISVEYEVDFVSLPDSIQAGDRINIIDEQGELYLEARLLHIESSVTSSSISATIGDYVLKSSGVSAEVKAIAKSFAESAKTSVVSVGIIATKTATTNVSLLTATVYKDNAVISDSESLAAAFTNGEYLQWFKDGTEIGGANDFTYTADLTTGTKYTCKLMVESEDE